MNAEYNALKNGETNLEEFDGGNHTICNLYVDMLRIKRIPKEIIMAVFLCTQRYGERSYY